MNLVISPGHSSFLASFLVSPSLLSYCTVTSVSKMRHNEKQENIRVSPSVRCSEAFSPGANWKTAIRPFSLPRNLGYFNVSPLSLSLNCFSLFSAEERQCVREEFGCKSTWQRRLNFQVCKRAGACVTSAQHIGKRVDGIPFRGDTKEYQRAVGAEQLHSRDKEKCKVNNTVSWQYINQWNNPQRRNQSLMSDWAAGEGEWQGDEKAYSVIQPSPADRSRHYVRNRA